MFTIPVTALQLWVDESLWPFDFNSSVREIEFREQLIHAWVISEPYLDYMSLKNPIHVLLGSDLN